MIINQQGGWRLLSLDLRDPSIEFLDWENKANKSSANPSDYWN